MIHINYCIMIPGQIYRDKPSEGIFTTYLEFIGHYSDHRGNFWEFKQVGGLMKYHENCHGQIRIRIDKYLPNIYYALELDELINQLKYG